jgi:hypothetical protein
VNTLSSLQVHQEMKAPSYWCSFSQQAYDALLHWCKCCCQKSGKMCTITRPSPTHGPPPTCSPAHPPGAFVHYVRTNRLGVEEQSACPRALSVLFLIHQFWHSYVRMNSHWRGRPAGTPAQRSPITHLFVCLANINWRGRTAHPPTRPQSSLSTTPILAFVREDE